MTKREALEDSSLETEQRHRIHAQFNHLNRTLMSVQIQILSANLDKLPILKLVEKPRGTCYSNDPPGNNGFDSIELTVVFVVLCVGLSASKSPNIMMEVLFGAWPGA